MRRKILLLGAATALALLAGEALSRLFVRARNVGPSFTEYDPVLGQVHKKNLVTTRWTPEFTMTFTTNSLGFRGPEPGGPVPAGGFEILFVGDSFTEGFGVNDGEEFPERVARLLAEESFERPVRVVNAGIGASGTGRAVRFLRSWAREPRPPTLLVHQFSPNDFADNGIEGFFALAADGSLVERPMPVPRPFLRRLQPGIEAVPGLMRSHLLSAFLEWLKLRRTGSEGDAAPGLAAEGMGDKLTYRLVGEVLRMAKENGWPVVGILFGLDPEREGRLRALYDGEGAAAVVLPGKGDRPDLYHRVDGHWNRAGHSHVAQALASAIRSGIEKTARAPR